MSEQMPTRSARPDEVTRGWVMGVVMFAAVMMVIIGIFHIIVGFSAILQSQVYLVEGNYVFRFSLTSWGWVHLLAGILVAVTGVFIFTGQPWARMVGIALVGVSAIANFMFIPYSPFGSILLIALDVIVIWALAVYGRHAAETVPRGH